MRVLVACEFSGIVRDAFRRRGHDAWSCDYLATERPGPHIQGDCLRAMRSQPWDLMIAHPECTHLALSGARWCTDHWVRNKAGEPLYWHDGFEKRLKRDAALEFFRTLLEFEAIPKRCIEQPMSVASSMVEPFTQRIQPYEFGHGERKETWLWLRGLPLLVPTKHVPGRESRVHKEGKGPDRKKNRSRTFEGIAEAMAAQWG